MLAVLMDSFAGGGFLGASLGGCLCGGVFCAALSARVLTCLRTGTDKGNPTV